MFLPHQYRTTSHGWYDMPPVKQTFMVFLAPFIGRPAKMLEIGGWEGVSACTFLDVVGERASLTVIDPFTGSKEHDSPTHLEEYFDENIRRGGHGSKLRKLKELSGAALPRLLCDPLERSSYDFIYIDGSHIARDVLSDAVMCFELLKPEGILVFDDYLWTDLPHPLDQPKIAIEAFVRIYSRELKVVHQDYRVFLQKLPHPAE